MLFAWKIEYLFQTENSKGKNIFEIQSVVIVTDRYEFGIAEQYFKNMFPTAKRIIAIEYICEAANGNLMILDPTFEKKSESKLRSDINMNEDGNWKVAGRLK